MTFFKNINKTIKKIKEYIKENPVIWIILLLLWSNTALANNFKKYRVEIYNNVPDCCKEAVIEFDNNYFPEKEINENTDYIWE